MDLAKEVVSDNAMKEVGQDQVRAKEVDMLLVSDQNSPMKDGPAKPRERIRDGLLLSFEVVVTPPLRALGYFGAIYRWRRTFPLGESRHRTRLVVALLGCLSW